MSPSAELVKITVDGVEISVPKGMNIIEAARVAGVEIPHYCYHPHLSVAGNCRMCQVQIEGQPKLGIACNMTATEGLKIRTQESSPEVSDAQRATLEFLLINHPLDCTVCDQAGHCKLQDYYYEYNRTASRFIEEKQHKVKAEVLGPEVIYDGERCIVCTRCSRFCEEITETSELGVFNRGDRSVIGVIAGKELDNPLSGTVVDLCPVGALTHRQWRFNTRIWYTDQKNTICTGCSTGCNANVATRDGSIVHVKGRLNAAVNKEWMCDEGRYGFDRFQPRERLLTPAVRGAGSLNGSSWEQALRETTALKTGPAEELGIFLSPFLTLEEMWTALQVAEICGVTPNSPQLVVAFRGRSLTKTEALLISPDYAPNARGAGVLGLIDRNDQNWRATLESRYDALLQRLKSGKLRRVLFAGDRAIAPQDLSVELCGQIERCNVSVATTARATDEDSVELAYHRACSVLFPEVTVHEKTGVMVNTMERLQMLRALLPQPHGTLPTWAILNKLGAALGRQILPAEVKDDRSLMRHMASKVSVLAGLTPMKLGELGLTLDELKNSGQGTSAPQQAGAPA